MRDHRFQGLGVLHPGLHHGEGRKLANQAPAAAFIDFRHLGVEVLGVTIAQFLYRIHSGAFQQFGILAADPRTR